MCLQAPPAKGMSGAGGNGLATMRMVKHQLEGACMDKIVSLWRFRSHVPGARNTAALGEATLCAVALEVRRPYRPAAEDRASAHRWPAGSLPPRLGIYERSWGGRSCELDTWTSVALTFAEVGRSRRAA